MAQLGYEHFYSIAGVKQHSEFEAYLRKIIFLPDERNEFYKKLLGINNDLSIDTFKPYFELYAAERKSNQQDYTPDSVGRILANLTRQGKIESQYTAYDPTAGTGSLIIQKWYDDMMQESIFSYAPHRYFYRADEIADNVIPYLIHNFAMRGMNAVIVHGDVLERHVKQVYLIQNSKDDFMGFSDVNLLKHSEGVQKEFRIREWLEDEIDYKETEEVKFRYANKMKRQKMETNPNPKLPARVPIQDMVLLKDIAIMERAKKGQMYPEGTVIVQISATKGQVGLLTSDGEVGPQYVCINFNPTICLGDYGFYWLKEKLPRHIHRVQQGLNITFEDLQKTPMYIPPVKEQAQIINTIREESGQYAFDF